MSNHEKPTPAGLSESVLRDIETGKRTHIVVPVINRFVARTRTEHSAWLDQDRTYELLTPLAHEIEKISSYSLEVVDLAVIWRNVNAHAFPRSIYPGYALAEILSSDWAVMNEETGERRAQGVAAHMLKTGRLPQKTVLDDEDLLISMKKRLGLLQQTVRSVDEGMEGRYTFETMRENMGNGMAPVMLAVDLALGRFGY